VIFRDYAEAEAVFEAFLQGSLAAKLEVGSWFLADDDNSCLTCLAPLMPGEQVSIMMRRDPADRTAAVLARVCAACVSRPGHLQRVRSVFRGTFESRRPRRERRRLKALRRGAKA